MGYRTSAPRSRSRPGHLRRECPAGDPASRQSRDPHLGTRAYTARAKMFEPPAKRSAMTSNCSTIARTITPVLAINSARTWSRSSCSSSKTRSVRRTSGISRTCGNRPAPDRQWGVVNNPNEFRLAHHRAAHRLHPHPHFADRGWRRRGGGGAVRVLRRPHRLARAGDVSPSATRATFTSTWRSRLRHPGAKSSIRRAGLFSRVPGAQGRLLLANDKRAGNGYQRDRDDTVPVADDPPST